VTWRRLAVLEIRPRVLPRLRHQIVAVVGTPVRCEARLTENATVFRRLIVEPVTLYCKIDTGFPGCTLNDAMTATEPPQEEWIPTRHSLITRLKNWDDRDGWRQFFDTYWKLIYGVARKSGLNDAEAQEVVQETVVTVAKGIKNFESGAEHGSFKGWLLANVRWRIIDQFRKRAPEEQRRIHRGPDDTGRTGTLERLPDPHGPELEAVWDEEWGKNLMDRALDRAKERVKFKHYQIFYLNVIKEMPAPEVAKALDVSLGTVYVTKLRVSRMVKKIYEELKEEEAR